MDNDEELLREIEAEERRERRQALIDEWRQENTAAYGYRAAYRKAAEKDLSPPEYIRKIVKENGDLSGQRLRSERRICVKLLQYVPLALFKLLENMPMPWEEARYVDTLYDTRGLLTIVDETPTVSESLYKAQWGSVWTKMRANKVELVGQGGIFDRINEEGDPNEPPLDFGDHLMDRLPPPPLTEDLNDEDDAEIAQWFYDPYPRLTAPNQIRGPRRPGGYYFSMEVMETLFRQAMPLLPRLGDRSYFYLWDMRSFYTAKAMHVAIPRAPRFEPPPAITAHGEADDDWTEFNDLRRVIHRDNPRNPRFTMRTERQIAFPFLYGEVEQGVQLAPYHYPSSVRVENDDPELPVFWFNPLLNIVKAPARKFNESNLSQAHLTLAPLCEGNEEDVVLPDDFRPFLAESPLETLPETRQGLSLLFAPAPYNRFDGGMKRRIDVPLGDSWFQDPADLITEDTRDKTLHSYTQLLKRHVKRSLHRSRDAKKRKEMKSEAAAAAPEDYDGIDDDWARQPLRRLDKFFQESQFFAKTKMDWLEAGLQLMRQGHNMLVHFINMKGITFVHIDYNFIAKPTRVLTTKEIKKSRLGQAFHMIRSLLGMVKRLLDLHVLYRLGRCSAHELADATHYLFNHIGTLNEIYRFKLKAMHQIKETRDYKHVVHSKFNVGEVPRGPGCGFWGPAWRIWIFFYRGMTPLLQRYLGNLTDRVLEGRTKKDRFSGKRITRQRVETDKDVNIKEAFRRELRELLPDAVNKDGIVKTMDGHMNNAFRCWLAGEPWAIEGMAKPLEDIVRKYVRLRSDEYIRITQLQRIRIAEGDTVDRSAFKKNLGRMTRLKVLDEQRRQREYSSGTDTDNQLLKSDAVEILNMMAGWLSDRGFKKIPFPDTTKTAELNLLQLSLNRLRDQHNIANRLTGSQREEQKRIEEAFNAPHKALSEIIRSLAQQRRFKNVEVEYMDSFSHLFPIYNVVPEEKMVDAFLDQYLWYMAMNRQRLFPSWVKPADSEPAPQLLHKFCEGINNSPDIWDVSKDESVVLLHSDLQASFYDNVDWTLFRRFLELIMDQSLVDYIVSRHNVIVEFKDMKFEHRKGLIRGFMFSAFLAQYWGLVMDVMLLGTRRSTEIAGTSLKPNPFMSFFRDPFLAASHPIRGYCRYKNECYILLRFTKQEADGIRRAYLDETKSDPALRAANASVYGMKNAKQWPRDARMRLFLSDVNLARAVLWEFSGRAPPSLFPIDASNTVVSVYSKDNPNLLFDMAGFSVRLLPVSRTELEVLESENMWSLRDHASHDVTCRAFLQVSPDHVERIRNKARHMVMMVGSSRFHSISAKWNALLTEIVPYYREAILGTEELQAILARAEHRMQARVMMALNSRANARFPPAMFYAPSEFGGLGMLSVGHSLIPAKDVVYSKTTSTGVQAFYSGLTNSENIPIPNILQYYASWETEVRESERAWQEFHQKEREAKAVGGRVGIDEIEDIIDKGLPRIRVRFSRYAPLFHYDSGFRSRMEFQCYQMGKYLKNWWFHPEHDGNVCGRVLEKYREDMNIALGGIEAILEHSLFKGTGFPSWEGLEFNRSGGFENSKKDTKLAKQQRAGLTQVPNQRFALWWSPTINRRDIQAGFETPIDTTGVFMCGKLETIKKSLIKIFSGSLWEKCHGTVVNDIASKLRASLAEIGAATVTLQQQHPQKSFTFRSSAADIVLDSAARWPVTTLPMLLSELGGPRPPTTSTSKYWIDVQLRWGNYDEHNISEYARRKFFEYSKSKMYPFPAGAIVAIDLAYNCFAAFGYWVPDMVPLFSKLLPAVVKHNTALNTLRDRMKRELGLFSSAPTEASLTENNIAELYSGEMRTWIVDASHARSTKEEPTPDGGHKFKAENGAVLLFEPRSGLMKMSIIHKSVFTGQKRRTKLARDKAAEEVASWLRSTPKSDLPSKIIVTSSNFRQVLHNMLVLDYPNIVVGRSELNLPLPMILRHSRLEELRMNAVQNEGREFCLYDDWQRSLLFQPKTCYDLLNLILRGYHANQDRSMQILVPDLHVTVAPDHFWPTYTTVLEWKEVSMRLQELILADAARRLNVASPKNFTEKEKADILMGKKLSSLEVQEEQTKELEAMRKTKLAHTAVVEVTTSTGEVKRKRVRTGFDFGSSSLDTNWRLRSLADSALFNGQTAVESLSHGATAASDQVIFPEDTLQQLLACVDVKAPCVGYLFGHVLQHSPNIKEVLCVMIPPQCSTGQDIRTPARIPFSTTPALVEHNLSFVGLLRIGEADLEANSRDVALLGRLLEMNPDMPIGGTMLVCIQVDEAGVVTQSFTVTNAGVELGRTTYESALKQTVKDVPQECYAGGRFKVSTESSGFFLCPKDGTWNYAFRSSLWADDDDFEVTVDAPKRFFDREHRPDHFVAFLRKDENTDAPLDTMDDNDVFNDEGGF